MNHQSTRRLLAMLAIGVSFAFQLGCAKSELDRCRDEIYDLAKETGVPAGSREEVTRACEFQLEMDS